MSSTSSQSSRRSPLVLWLVFAVGLILVTLSLVEVALRMTGRVSTEGVHVASASTYDNIPGVFDPGQRVTERPRAELAHRISINSLGFRGEEVTLEKAQGKFRILCLGDSFTFGSFVNDEDTLPHLLGETLARRGKSVEVINGGVGGTTIIDQAHFLQKGLVMKPDLVLLTFSENDVDDLNKTVPLHETMAANRKWKSGVMGPIYQVTRDTALFNFLLLAKAWYADLTTPRAIVKGSAGASAESDRLWDRYDAEFGKMADLLRSQSIGFVFAVFPSDYRIGKPLEPGNRLERVSKVAERHGVPVIDLLEPLQASRLTSMELYLLPYDGHPSRRGYGIATDAMSTYLINHGLLEKTDSGQMAGNSRPSS